jgi:hypothetical protein
MSAELPRFCTRAALIAHVSLGADVGDGVAVGGCGVGVSVGAGVLVAVAIETIGTEVSVGVGIGVFVGTAVFTAVGAGVAVCTPNSPSVNGPDETGGCVLVVDLADASTTRLPKP